MRILGADPGIANFGLALVEFVDDDVNLVAGQHVSTEAGADYFERMDYIYKRVGKIAWMADAYATEDCSAWGNQGMVIKWVFAAQVRADSAAYEIDMPRARMRESRWKKTLGLKRTCTKRDIEDYVRSVARVAPLVDRLPDSKRNHVMDAAAIAIAAHELRLFDDARD